MSIATGTYAEVQDVETRIGDLVSGRVFTATTTPTIGQVEQALDNVAARINGTLDGAGYTAPISEDDYPYAFAWARAANSAGAAAEVLNYLPGQALTVARAGGVTDEDESSPNLNRRSGLMAELNAFLKAARDGTIRATRTVAKTARFKAGSATDADGNLTKPAFTRGAFDYPGGAVRTEASDV